MLPTTSTMALSYSSTSRLCRACLLKSRSALPTSQPRRSIGTRLIAKREEAARDWAERAEKIKNGEQENLWDHFKKRGYVKDTAGTDETIRELMRVKRVGAYVGIDPTAASLHLGHLLPLMPLFWMYMHGYSAITVLGGATCKIGDPTDRLTSREEVSAATRGTYVTKMHFQLKRLWLNVDSQARRHGYQRQWAWSRALLNNTAWYTSTPFYEIVARLFNGVRIGPMLSRDTVKNKMNNGDGMSLGEFIYPMMQAWDWWHMFKGHKISMQIGGSDQYGNIVAGVDAVKYLRDTEPQTLVKMPDDLLHTPVGFTVPLLTDSSGAKFGKSAGNAMWLDPFMTSAFDLYGYFMRRPDSDIEQLLKLFTFLPLEKIDQIMAKHNEDPSKRVAHHTLALEVLALTHGFPEAQKTQEEHQLRFGKGNTIPQFVPEQEQATPEDGTYPQKGVPAGTDLAIKFRADIQLPESLILGKSVARILYAAGLATSASDANRLIAHQGAYVGGAPGRSSDKSKKIMQDGALTFHSVKNWFVDDTKNFLIDGKLLILRRGKHFVRIVQMVSDEEWKASGKSYLGEAGSGYLRQLRQRLNDANGGKSLGLTANELARVGEQVARIEREGRIALEDAADAETATPPQIKFPPERSRAAKLLDNYSRKQMEIPGYHKSVQRKTTAIDKVLGDTYEGMEQERKKRRDAWDMKRKTAAIDSVLEEAKAVLDERKRLRDELQARADRVTSPELEQAMKLDEKSSESSESSEGERGSKDKV
ncbi:tRNA synthetase class I [Xylariaceae sp. FL0255]|nr:tRNA synthetase class I [Xylariaceae sp. FL0255]